MGLEHERDRILAFVSNERARLNPHLERLHKERRSSKAFVEVANLVFSVLNDHLSARLQAVIDTVGPVSVQLASKRLNDLYVGVDQTIGLISGVVASQDGIARELECVVEWFFDKCAPFAAPPTYVIHVSTELFTLDFRQFLTSFFEPLGSGSIRRDIFPELTSVFAANAFFIIHMPASMTLMSGAVDWPLVFHECGHAIELRANVIAGQFPGVPADRAVLKALAKTGDQSAIEALWTQELLCDFLAVHLTGPAFIWRFLQQYLWIVSIAHTSFSHPRVDVRMRRLIEVLRLHGFVEDAQLGEELLRKLLEDLKGVPMPAVPPLVAADATQAIYAARLAAFTRDQFNSTLADRCGQPPAQLRLDIIEKRPVVLDPASLFTLVAFQVECETAEIAARLADFLRLNSIASRFVAKGLHD